MKLCRKGGVVCRPHQSAKKLPVVSVSIIPSLGASAASSITMFAALIGGGVAKWATGRADMMAGRDETAAMRPAGAKYAPDRVAEPASSSVVVRISRPIDSVLFGEVCDSLRNLATRTARCRRILSISARPSERL